MGRSVYMKRLWRDLPPELLENVLARLPMHVLGRFRVVSKTWNTLLSQPTFATLCALAPRQASSVLISPKVVDYTLTDTTSSTNWYVMDVAENRYYRLPDSFITDYHRCNTSKQGLASAYWNWGWSKYTLAADGGLIYTMYSSSGLGHSRSTTPVHMVCNPVSKSFHEIPEPELHCSYDRDIVVMSVDNVTKSYKIITMESHDDTTKPGRQEVHLYDSTTCVWRKHCEAPEHGYCAYSSIFMNGVFYTLFVDFPIKSKSYSIMLYSCDLATGAWSKIDVGLPQLSVQQEKPQLVVSLGRLFMVEYTERRKQLVKLRIWEIVLAKKEVVKVTEIQKLSKYSRKRLQDPEESNMGEPVVAVGCAGSIVISCVMGRLVKFDLLKKLWYDLPAYAPSSGYGTHCRGICSGLIDL